MLKKTRLVLATSAVLALLAGSAVSAATAAVPVGGANGTDGPYYVLDALDGTPVPAGKVLSYDYNVVGGPSATDPMARFIGPADATGVMTFIAPRGSERNINSWISFSEGALEEGTTNNWLPVATPREQILGNPDGPLSTGGDFSVGVAFVKNYGLNLASTGMYFTYISVTAGTGAYTFETPGGATTPAAGTADIPLSAEVAAPAPVVDGALSLVVASGATATIGAPTMVNGISTSTGSLPDVTVKDARALTHKGWTLTSKVADFVSGEVKIPAAQLTVSPKVKTSPAAGVTAASSAAASNTDTPFAAADDSATVGDTVLNADLTFVAPSASTPAGTYTSKMTLTLVSK
jgi:hypothetical protein